MEAATSLSRSIVFGVQSVSKELLEQGAVVISQLERLIQEMERIYAAEKAAAKQSRRKLRPKTKDRLRRHSFTAFRPSLCYTYAGH